MKKLFPKLIFILSTLFVIHLLAKYGYENLWINGRLIASENRTHDTGIVSRYLTLGKEPGGNNYYIIYQNDREDNYYNHLETVPSIYAIDTHLIQTDKTLYKSVEENLWITQGDMKDFKIKLYSIGTGKVIKEIDINKRLKNQYGDVQTTKFSFETLTYNNRPCLAFYIEDRPKSVEQGKIDTERRVCINLETEEIFELEKEKKTVFPLDRKLHIFNHSTVIKDNGLLDDEEEGYFVASLPNWEGTCRIGFVLSGLPKENVELYTMFPDLREKSEDIVKKGGEPRIHIYLTGDPTEEEIMRLFLPEGRKISFENVWISGEHSIDGEDHKVGSFEEYQKYLKEFDNVAKVSPIFKSRP